MESNYSLLDLPLKTGEYERLINIMIEVTLLTRIPHKLNIKSVNVMIWSTRSVLKEGFQNLKLKYPPLPAILCYRGGIGL